MNAPAISVVTVCRNPGQELPAAAASVRAALGPGDEWVVQDGASTDGTADFLRDLADARVLRQRDGAGFRGELAGNDAEQRGLAGAVAADKTHFHAARQRKGGVIDEETPGNAGGEAGNRDHAGSIEQFLRKCEAVLRAQSREDAGRAAYAALPAR